MGAENRDLPSALHRREFLLLMASAGFASACTPLQIGLKIYPRDFKENTQLVDETLRAFVLTVVPGMPKDDPNLIRVFHDELFRVDTHRGWLAFDLCDRARDLTGEPRFVALEYADRERVISAALAAGGVTKRLYTAAIYVSQIAIYAGIYDDDAGCPVWSFDGGFRIEELAALPDPPPDTLHRMESAGGGNPL